MPPLRVMHVVLQLTTGGLEKFLIDVIPRFNKQRVLSEVCCIEERGNMAKKLECMGIKIYLIKKKELGQIKFYSQLRKLFVSENIDVVHSYSGIYRDAIIASKLARIPVNVHTDQGKLYPDTKKARINHWLFSNFRDCIVSVSDELRDFLTDEIRLNRSKTKTIYNGVAVEDHVLKVDMEKKKSELNLRVHEKIVGIIARLVAVKDHKTLFAAFKKARKNYSDMKLLVVGDGPLAEDLKQYAIELGEDKNIVLLGRRDDVKELLHIMDIVCLSSLHEGLSLTLLEAMASGRPVVATDVGGNRELVLDRMTGLLVPSQNQDRLAEAITELVKDDVKREKMGQAGRQRVQEKFNIYKTAQQYEDLYSSLINQKGIAR